MPDATSDPVDFPFKNLLGFTIDSGDGRSVAALTVDERHMNPNNVVHGAVLFALVDTAMGGATMSVVGEGKWCATIDINTRFIAPCFSGTITAEATVRRAGRRVVHLDASVTGDDGREYVAATGSFAVVDGTL